MGSLFLGIEFGSTRIKAVLIDGEHKPIAVGGFAWESALQDGCWTYPLDGVWAGLRHAYAELRKDYFQKTGQGLQKLDGIGVSAMMHGYLAFDAKGELLVPFRTWRNTITEEAAAILTKSFDYNIPQRWSIAHLYQAILNGEPHVKHIAALNTLAGCVHEKLTGCRALGIGDASGMFPIDPVAKGYDERYLASFRELVAGCGFGWDIADVLPPPLAAGEYAGALTPEGAALLDPSGALMAGAPFCPPEGDAGTGMVATNAVAARTGNVSAGTSIFAMIVLENPLSRVYAEIDMVATPTGKPVAMVHCNSGSADLDAWIHLLGEAAALFGNAPEKDTLFDTLYEKALDGEPLCGGLISYNYFSGEPVTGIDDGRPLLVRKPDARLTVANLMKLSLYSSLATLTIGMETLTKKEQVQIDRLLGHGGLFKAQGVAQTLMASALRIPVGVMETAGEGGAWGIALLAAYAVKKQEGEPLEAYLSKKVFHGAADSVLAPDGDIAEDFAAWLEAYRKGFDIEKTAVLVF
jgi:sugar (pentulose or hexulose) kinase